MKHFYLNTALVLTLAAMTTACGGADSQSSEAPAIRSMEAHQANVVVPSDESLMGDALEIESAQYIEAFAIDGEFKKLLSKKVSPGAVQAARQAYAQGLFKPLWTPSGVNDLQRMPDVMRAHGLETGDVLDQTIGDLISRRFTGETAEARADADIDLTAAWLKMASAISGGLSDEGDGVKSTTDRPVKSSLVDAIRDAGKGESVDAILRFAPAVQQYPKLMKSLTEYRALAQAGGWKSIRSGDAFELGESDDRVPALRERLMAEGYMKTQPSIERENEIEYDAETESALKKFQSRHGLNPDGVIGNDTLEALNESAASKVDRIESAMEEWRDYDDMGRRHIWTNIPSYTAEGWNNGKRQIKMKTIVGKPGTSTPAFSDEVEFVISNPKWFVPKGIMRRQKLRKLRSDPNYAERMDFTIYDRSTREIVPASSVDWSAPGVANDYQMVQDPGAKNALGRLKIIFPNRYSVYLHGTPQKNLFDRAERAFSSGCVRLEDPVAMATWIAKGDDDINRKDILESQVEKERERFTLDDHLPVHITYVTVTVDDDGTTHFLRDIYDQHPPNELAAEKYADFVHQEPETGMTDTNSTGIPEQQ